VSDRRLKKDIQNLMTGQLDKVLKLQGVSFKMIEDAAGRTELGLIAQDVQELFPELVQESGSGTLSLNYTGLIAPMIEAMKEQQAQIDELKKMNASLVSRIEALEARP
jgi:trimeric autotransporter adhesin